MNARARMIADGWVVVPVVLSVLTSPATAQHPIPESQRWATITHAGNAPFVDPEYNPNGIGRVDYEYQISRTEVTYGEWFEFVQAYAPYVAENAWTDKGFFGDWIYIVGYRQYALDPRGANQAAEMSWRYAARYCNWLHNGRANTREAFQRGVYDDSTFTTNADGTFNDQAVRSPGATYWIPNADEWTKATYFDPNRYGEEQAGYWSFPNMSDEPPRIGLPAAGGTSSIGLSRRAPDVASYVDQLSPWGLWDTSGGTAEWLEDSFARPPLGPFKRLTRGSSKWDTSLDIGRERDQVERLWSASIHSTETGLRIARVVPAPSSILMLSGVVFILGRGRRR